MRLKSGKIIGILFGMALMIGLMAPAAFASVTFQLQDGSGAPYTLTSLDPTTGDPLTYSSYYCNQGTYKYYDAKGQNLLSMINTALTGSGFSSGDVDYVEFIGSDGYDTDDYGAITLGDLSGYYYYSPTTSPGTAVAPIIATQYRTRDTGDFSPANCPRNFYGQPGPTGGADEDTMQMWVKGLSTVVLKVNQ
ncbi:hypothetical protein Psch_01568 [Pelotomaculum schinkii]|uniref:Uncharacterized protein n=1 Tax=Pelotomaculum schinkii TaxID=78350 RepID=A0A4Y7RGU6_9FIRM|nr:hypothetical protein [Pelotomaculum schinkii]TEB08013.1 hypothetical protein Psch_01568 [Pelotomaculum schinkii]